MDMLNSYTKDIWWIACSTCAFYSDDINEGYDRLDVIGPRGQRECNSFFNMNVYV